MQQQLPQQSPPQDPNPPSMTPFKKRLLHRVEDSDTHYLSPTDKKEDGEFASETHEREEIEYKNPSYEDERFEREYMNEHDERKLEEHELSDDNLYDEHGFDQDGYRKERHNVVRERQKKKELEVFVGGLDRDTTEVDLREVFSEIGDITEVRLLMNPMTNKNKGFAFIRFATVEQARRALNDFKHPMINGKQCGVAPSQDSDTLFVGNICKTWSKDMLKEKLVRYGIDKFEELTLVEDAKTVGMNRGFAFLDFPTRADALEACRRLQKRDVIFGTDRTARVAFADTFIEPDDEIMAQVRTVFVDGLPPSWEEDIIKEHLKQFGKIEKVELARNMPAAKRDDFGFITFSTHESAVSCVDGINDSELVFRNKKVKVRARLSRPRQRGKSAKYALGGYTVGVESHRGYRSSWELSSNRMDSHRLSDRDRRSMRDRSPYDSGRRRSYDSRDNRDYDVSASDRKRTYSSTDRSLRRRSPVYERSGFRTQYSRQNDEWPVYRDSYSSRDASYVEDTSRNVSRVHGRRVYDDDDDSRYMYVDRPSRYNDGGSRNFGSSSSIKRPYSSIEEHHPRYTESSRRQSRAGFDYDNNSDLAYNDRIYGSEPTRLTRGSRNQGSAGHSSVSYRRVDIANDDPEEMYSRYGRERESRDYMPSRSEMREGSYSPGYSNHRATDGGYAGGRVSDSYY
ncbi:uncharacterized protein LOC143577985 [Bidens hawaiensis]|uniref:uncharacterized protein LOC143577985 n=1 Tax=Bidens hawaiensis TaxID=980011 RepID=UPI00404A8421